MCASVSIVPRATSRWAPLRRAHPFFLFSCSVLFFSPYNPPCTTLFLARLDQLSNEELYSLLVNSFGETLTGSKFMVDSKGQRIGQSTKANAERMIVLHSH